MRELLPQEYKLLVACARVVVSDEHLSQIGETLAGPIDWQRTLELAHLHRLSAFLATRLSHEELASRVPELVLQRFRTSYLGNAVSYLRFKAELLAALRALQAEGIPVILLKGIALAEEVYGDPALRPMGDVDILVSEHDVGRADQIIRELGYAPRVPTEVERQEKALHRHYPRLVNHDGTVFFEVHRHVVRKDSPLYFDISDLWSRAQAVSFAGTEALRLAPEDLLAHLCIGFFLDSRSRYPSRKALGRIVDIAETIRHFEAELDWDFFVKTLSSYGHLGPAAWSLMVTKRLLGAGGPEPILETINDGRLSDAMIELFIERRVLRRTPWIFHELLAPPDDSPWDSFKAALKRLFPSSSQLKERYARQDGSVGSSRLYRWHTLEVWRFFSQYLIQPRALWQELEIDRWLYATYGGSFGRR